MLVDSGVVRSRAPALLLARPGLEPHKPVAFKLADGRKSNADKAAGVMFEIMGRSSSDDAFVLSDEVLIGQTVLEKMDLLVD